MAYHQFTDDEGEYGSFETFEVSEKEVQESRELNSGDPDEAPFGAGPGWYWWPCFPGCVPDGDPMGPFATEQDALFDVKERSDDAES
jgi:hypothetical protein